MKTAHTSGPWEIEGTTRRGNPHIITAGKKGWVIAEVTNQELGGKYDLTEERSLANAKLISVSPIMFKALQKIAAEGRKALDKIARDEQQGGNEGIIGALVEVAELTIKTASNV